MLWIWLLLRHSHNASIPLERQFSFSCQHCHASMAAFVRMFGAGSGRDPWAAQAAAHNQAERAGHAAVMAAACPACGQLSPAMQMQLEDAAKRAATRKKIALPIAAAVAAVLAVVLLIPAIKDVQHSLGLMIVAGSVPSAASAFVYLILSMAVSAPHTNPYGVWFSHAWHGAEWFPARTGPAPLIAKANPVLRVLSWIVMVSMALVAIGGLVAWSESFRKVYVVNADPKATLTVQIDGSEVGRVSPTTTWSDDVPHAVYEVRTSSSHRVVLKDEGGHEWTYAVNADSSSYGWVIVPRALELDACLVDETWYYGSSPKDTDDVLNKQEPYDFISLGRRYDHFFVAPPSTSDQGTTRTTIRAYECEPLDKHQRVRLRDARRSTKPTTK